LVEENLLGERGVLEVGLLRELGTQKVGFPGERGVLKVGTLDERGTAEVGLCLLRERRTIEVANLHERGAIEDSVLGERGIGEDGVRKRGIGEIGFLRERGMVEPASRLEFSMRVLSGRENKSREVSDLIAVRCFLQYPFEFLLKFGVALLRIARVQETGRFLVMLGSRVNLAVTAST
jgi:hypothetical protein